MNRSDIPAALRVTRAADVARIPLAALAKMTPADVAPRLLAADAFRAKGRRPGLAPDMASGYAALASEILTTADPKRATALMKTAGAVSAPAKPAGPSAPLRKAATGAPRSLTVATPALDVVAGSRSLTEGLTRLMRSGRLGEAQREMGQLAKAAETVDGTSRAARYDQQAARVTDPELRRGYTEMAARARQEAGAA